MDLWRFGGLNLRDLGIRVWDEASNHDILGQAAKLSYYFVLALFPFLLFATTVFGYFARDQQFRSDIVGQLGNVLPPSAYQLIMQTLDQVSSRATGGKLSIGIVGTLWAASSGMVALIGALNSAYRIRDQRPWWKVRLIALGFTLASVLFTALSLILVLAGSEIISYSADALQIGDAGATLLSLVRWPVALFLVLVGLDLVYRFAPSVRNRRWHWLSPGAAVALFLWLVASMAFRVYLAHFNSYGATYGSVGAVVILMLWFYMTAFAILIGAETNAIIEGAPAERRPAPRQAPAPAPSVRKAGG